MAQETGDHPLLSSQEEPQEQESAEDRRMWDSYRKRYTVERTLAWISPFRRLVVRYEHHVSVNTGVLPSSLSHHRHEVDMIFETSPRDLPKGSPALYCGQLLWEFRFHDREINPTTFPLGEGVGAMYPDRSNKNDSCP